MRKNTVSEMQRFINLRLGVYFTWVRLCLRWSERSQILKLDVFSWMSPNCDTWSSNFHFLPSSINFNRIHSSKFTNYSFLCFNPLHPLTTLPFKINFKIIRHGKKKILQHCTVQIWSQWPRGLRRGSATARLLGLRVRNLPGVWMSVFCECC